MGIPFAAAVKQSASAAGWYRRRLSRDTFPGVAVLCYHGVLPARPTGTMPFEGLHVTAADLNEHCAVIRDTCHPISLDEWRGALAGRGALPARPILLTFDDGYRNVYTTARRSRRSGRRIRKVNRGGRLGVPARQAGTAGCGRGAARAYAPGGSCGAGRPPIVRDRISFGKPSNTGRARTRATARRN